MLVAQVAPPPSAPAGTTTELTVQRLSEELAARGHEVVRLPSTVETDQLADFEVVHAHGDHLACPAALSWSVPSLHTLHGRLDRPDCRRQFSQLTGLPLVSVSAVQRRPLADVPLRWAATIHDGTDLADFPFVESSGAYLAFIGRMTPDDGVEQAVELAERTGVPLRVAACDDPLGEDYWTDVLAPLFRSERVDYLGRLPCAERADFLGGALASVFPVVRPEPATAPVVESLACGTPVIAASGGVAREVIEDGVSGFLADTMLEMSKAVDEVGWLDRRACRRRAGWFGIEPMVERYELIYSRLTASPHQPRPRTRPVVRGPLPQPVAAVRG